MKKIFAMFSALVLGLLVLGHSVAAAGLDNPTDLDKNWCRNKGGVMRQLGGSWYCDFGNASKDADSTAKTACEGKGGVYVQSTPPSGSPELPQWHCDIGFGADYSSCAQLTDALKLQCKREKDNEYRQWKNDNRVDNDPASTDGSTGTEWNSGGKCVETSILGGGGEVCVGDEGEGIFSILTVALNVLTVGVGILAIIGFVITGIQYLTAKDNDGQIAKAKMRMLQIVIGLFVFATMWAILNWILPGGVFGNGGTSR